MVYIKRTRSFKRYILIDKIFVQFSTLVFQSTNGIPMGTNCTPLLAELCLHAYGANLLQGLLKNKDRKLTKTFISNFRHIDGVLSLNNSRFGDLIYPNELELKNTTDHDIQQPVSYRDPTLKSTTDDDKKQNSTPNVITSLFH